MLQILIGLVILILLAYRGNSIMWVAPLAAAVVAVLSRVPLLDSYVTTYMQGFVGFIAPNFPIFMFGAMFGHLMQYTGAARSIAVSLTNTLGAKRAILGVALGAAVLTYGGISLFVVVFAIYPIALELFREANISRRLIPGSIALGSFTFTMTAFPGTPQIQNIIPGQTFGTDSMAAPILGLVASAFMFGFGYLYLSRRQKKLTGEDDLFTEPQRSVGDVIPEEELPNIFLALLPLIAVAVTLNVLKMHIVVALVTGILTSMILSFKKYPGFAKVLSQGAEESVPAVMKTAAAVGFGSVVRIVPGFTILTNLVLGIKGHPLISAAVAVSVLAGATSSASGGIGIALEALGDQYIAIAAERGISLQAFHRVVSIASGGLDSLPHNGVILSLLDITEMTHKDSYMDIFIITVVLPTLSLIPVIALASLGVV